MRIHGQRLGPETHDPPHCQQRDYQQTSVCSKKLRARDPLNREIAVQSRWRLDAELVRDNALAVSGLLVEKIGGPSVKPYQPDGYWENLNFPVRKYDASTGPDQYRRGLYVWWQRSYLHPSLLAFDAPTREECAAERNRSDIPQQALVLLNDPDLRRSFAGPGRPGVEGRGRRYGFAPQLGLAPSPLSPPAPRGNQGHQTVARQATHRIPLRFQRGASAAQDRPDTTAARHRASGVGGVDEYRTRHPEFA